MNFPTHYWIRIFANINSIKIANILTYNNTTID